MSILYYRLIVRFEKLAPLGTKLLVHIKPEVREGWAPCATPTYYIGPALRHYRCYRVWITETNAERMSDTIAWFPHYTTLPIHTNQTTLLSAAYDLTQALLQPSLSSYSPPLSNNHFKSLLELAELFKNSIPVDAIAPSPDGDDITDADDVVVENHLTPNPPIADTLENIVPSPSPDIQINNDFPRVNIQSTNPASLPRVASPSTPCNNSHSLPRVASPPTYADKTINPNIRRRKVKKTSLTRVSFPLQAVE